MVSNSRAVCYLGLLGLVFFLILGGCHSNSPAGNRKALVSPPVVPPSEQRANLSVIRLATLKTRFALGEPVALNYTIVSPHNESKRFYEKEPRWIQFEVIVDRAGERKVFLIYGGGYPAEKRPKQGVSFIRLDMTLWEKASVGSRDLSGQKPKPLFPKPGKYSVRARFSKEALHTTIESNTVEFTVLAPNRREAEALDMLKGGMALWSPLGAAAGGVGDLPGRTDDKRPILERFDRRFSDTPYGPYVLFLLARDVSKGSELEVLGHSIPRVPRGVYRRFVRGYHASERLIAKYPSFCLRHQTYYQFIKSFGPAPSMRMLRINPKDSADVLGLARKVAELWEGFLKDYPDSPYSSDAREGLKSARDYIKKHAVAAP